MPLGELPENLEKVADAGGWEEREQQKALEAMAKIKPEQWKGINANLTILKDFMDLDAPGIFRQMKFSITETVSLKMQELFSPLKNEINAQINDILNPFIAEYLSPIMADLSGFLAANPEAAAAGGIVGMIGGMFLPGGEIWTILGALIAASTLQALNAIFPEYATRNVIGEYPLDFATWRRNRIHGTFAEYQEYLKNFEKYDHSSYVGDPYDRAPSGRPIY